MADIKVYTTPNCPYCVRAKQLLDDKGVAYESIDVSNPADREELIAKAQGRRTVPQIFIDDSLVGGYDDLAALDRAGKLDEMLAS